MKMKKRAVAILLALAMTLTLMPTVAFAGEKKVSDPKKHKQDTEIGVKGFKALENNEMGWRIKGDKRLELDEEECFYLWISNESGEELPSLQYKLSKDNGVVIEDWKDWNEYDEDGDLFKEIYTTELGVGNFNFEVREKSSTSNSQTHSMTVYSYGWTLENDGEKYLDLSLNDYCYFWIKNNGDGSLPSMQYRVLRDDDTKTEVKTWTDMTERDEEGDVYVIIYASMLGIGDYCFEVREKETPDNWMDYYFYVEQGYYTVNIGGLEYELNTENENDQAGLWGYTDEFKASSITVPSQVTLSNGKTYAVTYISSALYGLSTVKSITIPASVTEIMEGIGFYGYDEEGYKEYNKIPNFTIYGKKGSAAHQYAIDNGFIFKDVDEEAAAQAAARAAEQAAAQAADAQARAAAIAAASNINKGTVTAADIQKASSLGATTVTLGPKVKKIKKNSFKGTGITTIIVKTKKLKKGSVKGSLKGSKVSTVKVEIGSKKVNKKFVKKYKKIFTKKNAGKKAKVK